MGLIGNPSENNFKGLVSNNMITNCPITTTAITNARIIFGKDLASVSGKTVQWAPAPVVGDYVAIPKGVIEKNKTVTLAADVFFFEWNCIPIDGVEKYQVHYGQTCGYSYR
jgi:hypothetical protein